MNIKTLTKSLFYSAVLWFSIAEVSAQKTQKIGDNPYTIDTKAVLELESTTKGFLLPRMTTAQMNAITSPTESMMVYCTDCGVNSDGELRIAYNSVWQTFKGNVTGDISGNASTVTTIPNLTGPITSIGNTTSVASQTGTGTKFVMDSSPTFTGTVTIPTLVAGTNTFPTIQGTANQVLTTNGSGALSWATPSTTATAYSGVLQIANGGTGLTAVGTNGQVLTTNNAGVLEWTTPSSSTPSDATTSAKGIVKLAGDLAGTADVPVIAANAITSAKIIDDTIVDADINASAAIADTKLATIATAGKVSNSATTATTANTANTIVLRDANGNFTATNVSGVVAIANGGTGASTKTTAFDALSPMTAAGDIIYGGASGTGTRLPVGNNGQVLTINNSGVPSWSNSSGSGLSGTGTQYYLPKYGTGGTTLGNSKVFDNGSNVGIGTNNPEELFHISSSSGNAKAIINAFGENNEAHLMLRTGGINKTAIVASGINNWGRTDLSFILNSYTNANSYSSSDTKMIIKNDGKVGIGTLTPTEKLDVTGNIKTSGTITAGSFIKSGGTSSQFLMADGSVSTGGASGVSSFSGGSTGLTPNTTTTGVVTLGGTLNVANGGTGTTSLTGIVKANGTGAMTAATAGTDYLAPNGSAASLTNFPTFNQNTTGTATNVSGVVAVANGGTGLTAVGTNGQVLTTNNSGILEWTTPTSSTPSDATTSAKGIVKLAGDLAGTADAPVIAANAITSAKIIDDTIVDADINASAAIADTKLATIATAGKVSNSATTATTANTANTIVLRDANGDVTATNVSGIVAVTNGGTGVGTLTGIVKANGTGAMTAATAGTDYLAPNGSAASLTNFPTFNQNTTGTATNVSGVVAVANGGTGLSAVGSNGQVLTTSGSGTLTWSTPSSGVTSLDGLTDARHIGNSVYIGNSAGLSDNANNNKNVGIGFWTLKQNVGGYYNTATGAESLVANVTGNSNTASGYFSLKNNVSSGNSAFGRSSLTNNTSGSNNTAMGTYTLQNNTSGINNSAFGTFSLANNNGSSNTAGGYAALDANTSGSQNVAFGMSALNTNVTGNSNTAIGYDSDVASSSLSNTTAIGYGAIVAASNTIQLGNSAVTDVKTSGTITAGSFKTPSGTSSQFLKADGTVDSATYLTAAGTATNVSGVVAVANGGTGLTAVGTNGQVLTTNNTGGLEWTTPTSSTPSDATTSAKGIVKLAGDLVGTADAPVIAANAITSAKIIDDTIVDADINASAAIADTKLATIATAGKVSNSATTATTANTANTIVLRDANGDVTATNVSGIVAVTNGGTGVGTLTGIVKANGTGAMTAATAGTDYLAPNGSAASLTNFPTFNQNTTGTATNVSGVVAGANGGTGIDNTGKTITLGGNLTTSGAFATTLTTTATTDVTLPVTGTLSTLAGTETLTNKTLTSPILTTPDLGTPSAAVLTNATGLPLSTGVTGTLPVSNGGTGLTNVGTDGQVLTTNNAGTLSWTTPVVEVFDELTITNTGDTAFTLTATPATSSIVKMYVNGVLISKTGYTLSGTSLTYVPANNVNYALTAGDRVQFIYTK